MPTPNSGLQFLANSKIMLPKKLRIIGFLLLSFTCSITARGFEPAKPFPAQIESARYVFSDEKINKGIDVLMGASVNEELRFVFSGHQKGNNVSILFGVVGVAVAATANGAAGRKAGSDKKFTQEVTVPDIARQHVLDTFAGNETFRFDEDATARFEVIPNAFLAKNKKEGTSKLHAMLKLKLYENDAATKPVWLTRFYGEASDYLCDEDLLNPERVADALHQAYQRAAWGMLMIIDDAYELYQPEMIKAQFVGLKNNKQKAAAFVLSETEELLLLRFPHSKLSPFGGYSIIDKTNIERKVLKKMGDKYKKDFIR